MSTRERDWTLEEDQTLLQLRRAGVSLSIVGERINRSVKACSSRVSRLMREREARPRDYLAEQIESYLARIAKLNGYQVNDLKREAYGWR